MAKTVTLKDSTGAECYPKSHVKQIIDSDGKTQETINKENAEKLTELGKNIQKTCYIEDTEIYDNESPLHKRKSANGNVGENISFISEASCTVYMIEYTSGAVEVSIASGYTNKRVIYTDENDSILGILAKTANDYDLVTVELDIPEGTKKIYLNGNNEDIPVIKVTKMIPINEEISLMDEELKKISTAVYIKRETLQTLSQYKEAGNGLAEDISVGSAIKFGSDASVNCYRYEYNGGDIHVRGYSGYTTKRIVFTDASDVCIGIISKELKDYNLFDEDVSIPEGTIYMYINGYKGKEAIEVIQLDIQKISDAMLAAEQDIKDINDSISNIAIKTKEIDLFLFAGQSNMAGRGITNEVHNEDAPSVSEIAGLEYRAISDPTRLYPIDKFFGNTEDNPDGINDNKRKTGGMIPSFVNSYFSKTNTPIIGVSASVGGTSTTDWAVGGILLTDAINRLSTAKNWLLDNGYTVKHIFCLWCQGESDGDSASMTKELYKTNTDTIFKKLISEGIEKIFVVRIGEINNSTGDYGKIIEGQTELCKEYYDYIMATTVLASFKDKNMMKDEYHYYQDAYNIAGQYAGMNVGEYVVKNADPIMYDPKYENLFYTNNSY